MIILVKKILLIINFLFNFSGIIAASHDLVGSHFSRYAEALDCPDDALSQSFNDYARDEWIVFHPQKLSP